MMLIRFSLPSSNPITLIYTVHPVSDTEPKIGKSRKVENPDFSRSAPPHNSASQNSLCGPVVCNPGRERVPIPRLN